jgi:transcription antitermination protein NusB
MNQAGTSASVRGRVRARRCAVQALYQWQMSGQDPNQILSEFVAERELIKVDIEYFRTLIREIPEHLEILEQPLVDVLDRPISELNPVEHAVLLIGVYELKFRPDIPWRVVINEAVELAKLFGAEQSYRYVNGVLDKVARALRPSEARSIP